MRKNYVYYLLLSMLLLLLAGCGKTNTSETEYNDEAIKLSNILFQGTEMDPEQEKLLKAVSKVLEDATLDAEGYLLARNSTDQTLNIRIMAVFYEAEKKINGQSVISLNEWFPGSIIKMKFKGKPSSFQSVMVSAEIISGDTYLRTDFIPKKIQSDDLEVSLSFAYLLPVEVHTKDSVYLITEYSFGPTNTYNGVTGLPNYCGTLLITKKSGAENAEERIDYKVINDSTLAIADSGSIYLMGLAVGDVARVSINRNFQLEPGSYTLQLLGVSVESTGSLKMDEWAGLHGPFHN